MNQRIEVIANMLNYAVANCIFCYRKTRVDEITIREPWEETWNDWH